MRVQMLAVLLLFVSLLCAEGIRAASLAGGSESQHSEERRGESKVMVKREASESAPHVPMEKLVQRDANFTVVQSPSEVGVIRGDNATLNCTFSRGLSPDKGAVSWSRGGPGGEATVPLRTRFALAYPDTFLRRGEGTLAITNVSLEDAGKYVCRVLLWGTGEARGNGTQLRVYARPSHPVIFLQFHPKPESKWTLVCRTSGFYPPHAQLTWYRGSVHLPPTQPLQECGDPTGPLQASTTLDLPSSGPRATYTCQVGHPSLLVPLSTDYTYDPQHQEPPSLIAGLNLLKITLLGALSLGMGLAELRENPGVLATSPSVPTLTTRPSNLSWSLR
ncbi:Tapasin-related protein [Chelonia mydas]|uniref:Tapasin-related protein n=1 Tax=Chelonia mydas TaxID=8469 RepID=M7AIE5_CHEMY|nr:Tapasin-related protein [Chelonia mydas]